MHSPDSTDYSGDKDVSAYDFVAAFVERGFDLIAITDHNTGTFIDQAIKAGDEIAEKEGKKITVLAGVELSVSPGIHLLAILPGGGSASISDLLSRLELPVSHHGDTNKLISQSIGEIKRAVRERGGLLIGAHCNSTHGIVRELDGQSRLEWLSAVDAVEVNSESTSEKIAQTIDYVTKSLGVPIPFTYGSDSHNCQLAKPGMWVKMAEPSFASLRQLTFEPELRVTSSEPVAPTHARIIGFTVTQGIYADQRFRFSPNLNVLIGGRGAGKSAALDLLRFAFEAEPMIGDETDAVFTSRIMGFLQFVGEVVVAVRGTDGGIYVVTRSGAYEKPYARAAVVFTEPARVYQSAGSELIQREMRPLDVLGIEFYGQGEVAQLANRVDEQMRLIDENLDYAETDSAIGEAERQLIAGEKLLIRKRMRVDELRAEAATRPNLEERQSRLATSLADPIFAERTRWDRERTWIQGQQDWLQEVLHCLPESLPARSELPVDIEESTAKEILNKVRDASDRILETGGNDLESLRRTFSEAETELKTYRKEWDAAFEIGENRYRARLAELGASDLAEVAAEHRSVEQELTQIDTIVQPEIDQIDSEMRVLEVDRAALLVRLRDGRLEIARKRSDFVEELNSKLGGDVVVDLSGRDTSFYFNAVDNPLDGSGMIHREEQIELVCELFTPEKLVEVIRTNAIDQLTAIGVTDNNATRMRNGLSIDALYRVERVEVPQLPRIRIKREGETEYTDLSSLSVGEKCSAILSIALLSKGKPLVIDQPEDDLDHAFIVNSIVEGIRTAKSSRQIIAATHNPNIPVLGDAEMVFRVARRAGDDVCHILNSGGLELPQVTEEVQGLEGGADAFERRRRRYSGVV